MTWLKMVAFTATATLSLVITSCRSPVRGVSRMSTRTSRSRNGVMIASPAGDSRRKRPKRVTTPEKPWGTILMAEASTIATTMAMTAMMMPMARSIRSTPCERNHDQRGAANFNNHYLRLRREAAGFVCDRQPSFAGKTSMARMVLIAHGVDRQPTLTNKAVGRAGQLQPWTHPAVRCALPRGPYQHCSAQRHRCENDRADPHRDADGRDDGRGERSRRQEDREERLRVDLGCDQEQPRYHPDHPEPHVCSVPSGR